MQKPLVRPERFPQLFVTLLLATVLCAFKAPVDVAVNIHAVVFNDTASANSPAEEEFSIETFIEERMYIYDSLHLDEAGLSKRVYEMALKGMSRLVKKGKVKNNVLSIVDFSQPSINKRLYIIDLDNNELLFNTWVAHGVNSGKVEARSFSNKMSSHKSSLGFYVTGGVYNGSNGYSLKLIGVEKGINDYAMRRGIVIHGAGYVNEDYIESQGYIGRSYGCPAVAQECSRQIIDEVKDGTCLFIYHPTTYYTSRSSLLK